MRGRAWWSIDASAPSGIVALVQQCINWLSWRWRQRGRHLLWRLASALVVWHLLWWLAAADDDVSPRNCCHRRGRLSFVDVDIDIDVLRRGLSKNLPSSARNRTNALIRISVPNQCVCWTNFFASLCHLRFLKTKWNVNWHLHCPRGG
jgi:hypothetical protein